MENDFEKFNFSEMQIVKFLSHHPLKKPVYNFVHDTLSGKENQKCLFFGGIIYTVVVSNGKLPKEMAIDSNILINESAKEIITSKKFRISKDVIYVIAIIPGATFPDLGRTTKGVISRSIHNCYKRCHEECALLIREKLDNQDLEDILLSKIVIMHNPILDYSKKSRLLNVSNYEGGNCITARLDNPNNSWQRDAGFAFELFKIKS